MQKYSILTDLELSILPSNLPFQMRDMIPQKFPSLDTFYKQAEEAQSITAPAIKMKIDEI